VASVLSAVGVTALAAAPAQNKPPGDRERLQGAWVVVATERNGRRDTIDEPDPARQLRVIFAADVFVLKYGDASRAATFTLDAGRSPGRIELTGYADQQEKPVRGVYRLNGDKLLICLNDADPGGAAPAGFESTPGSGFLLMELKRAPAGQAPAPQGPAQRARSRNNLQQIAIAIHNYHSTHNHLPQHAICSKDGKPLLSWRVAILPYVEQDQLYKQFKLDEP
jgi:uncharacterized protein (TIGR03067 family)